MNMKKIAILALSLCMIAAIAVTGTIAYFSDTDTQTNVFTTGNVEIDLYEDFGDNDDEGIEELHPVTYDPTTGERRTDNVIEKEVYVENTGSEDAYVRVHIAIPSILDNGNPDFDAGKNVLHFNFSDESVAEGKWSWNKTVDGANYPENATEWNSYVYNVDKVDYNVYVVTYKTALTEGQATVDAMSQVYLDKKVTNADVSRITEKIGDKWKILVAAEATQAAGFINAYDALNEAFGVPGTYTMNFTAEAKQDTFLPLD